MATILTISNLDDLNKSLRPSQFKISDKFYKLEYESNDFSHILVTDNQYENNIPIKKIIIVIYRDIIFKNKTPVIKITFLNLDGFDDILGFTSYEIPPSEIKNKLSVVIDKFIK